MSDLARKLGGFVRRVIQEFTGDGPASWRLGIAIFLLPYVFVWVLLQKRFSTRARVIGFGWLAYCVLVPVYASKMGGGPQQRAEPALSAQPPIVAAAAPTPNTQPSTAPQPTADVVEPARPATFNADVLVIWKDLKGFVKLCSDSGANSSRIIAKGNIHYAYQASLLAQQQCQAHADAVSALSSDATAIGSEALAKAIANCGRGLTSKAGAFSSMARTVDQGMRPSKVQVAVLQMSNADQRIIECLANFVTVAASEGVEVKL